MFVLSQKYFSKTYFFSLFGFLAWCGQIISCLFHLLCDLLYFTRKMAKNSFLTTEKMMIVFTLLMWRGVWW